MATEAPMRDRHATRLLGAVALAVGLAVVSWSVLGGLYKGFAGESLDLVIPRGAVPARIADFVVRLSGCDPENHCIEDDR